MFKIGFTAEFRGSTNTARNAYKSAKKDTLNGMKTLAHFDLISFKFSNPFLLTRDLIIEKHAYFHSNYWNPA